MKIRSLGLTLLLTSFLLGGCAFMNDEDRDFYGKGWIHPTDLDKPASHHEYADPSQAPASTVANPTTAKRDPDPEWLIPETSDHPR